MAQFVRQGAARWLKATDLAVVMPRNIARLFAAAGGYALIEPPFPLRDFTVSLHWSRRFEADPGNQWLRQCIVGLFAQASGDKDFGATQETSAPSS